MGIGVHQAEVRYAGTGGVLLAAASRWLLVAADPTPEEAEELWAALSRPGAVVDALVDLLEKHHPEGVPSLAALDLTPGSVESATRGVGRISLDDGGRLLSLGHPTVVPDRRLVGGVVSAGCVRVSEIAPAPVGHTSAPGITVAGPPTGRPMIDGIPAHILAATAPDREPDASRLARALDSSPRSEVTEDPVGGVPPTYTHDPAAAFEPAQPPRRTADPGAHAGTAEAFDTGEPLDTGDPDHDGQTAFRPAAVLSSAADDPGSGDGSDEDDRTSHGVAGHLRHPTSETVLAVHCTAGHLTAAYTPDCRVCHLPVPAQDPQRVARPRLGAITLPTGEVVPLDRGVVLGRKPRSVPGGEPDPHLVHLPPESTYLSRLHLQIELDGWLVLARDLGSAGGTRLHVPGRDPEQLRAHEAYVLEEGHTLDLADVYPITFEVS